ncbi:hypothetical protein K8R03_03935 [Candidatus Kaiserbacteria bacterium]|nr:hypothetical protein [Candidatus Kaiserbacteria bacterium]
MFENWRHNRVARAAPDVPGNSSTPENTGAERLPVTEWLKQVKEKGSADALPAAPKGNKEKRALAEYLGNVALAAAVGEYKPRSPNEFESALKKYANSRSRVGSRMALLQAKAELDGRDNEGFDKVVAKLESKLHTIIEVAPDADAPAPGAAFSAFVKRNPEAAVASPVAAPASDDAGVDRMTEEELLKGLEGLAPPDEKTPAAAEGGEVDVEAVFDALKKMGTGDESGTDTPGERPKDVPEGFTEKLEDRGAGMLRIISSPDGKQTIGKPATAADIARLGGNVPPPAPREVIVKKSDESTAADEDEDVIAGRAKRIKSDATKRKVEKRAKKATTKAASGEASKPGSGAEGVEERETKIAAAIREVEERAGKGADPALMFQLVGSSLKGADRKLFIERFGEKHHINGTKIENLPPIVSLGESLKDVKAQLGEPDGEIEKKSFWKLPDGRAAMLDRHLVTIAPGGMHELYGTVYEYKDGAFRTMSQEEVDERRAKGVKEDADARKRTRTVERDEIPDRVKGAGREDIERADKDYGLNDAYVAYLEDRHKNIKRGTAFRDAARGLTSDDRERLGEMLVGKEMIEKAFVESAMRDLADEDRRNPKPARRPISRRERAPERPSREERREKDSKEPLTLKQALEKFDQRYFEDSEALGKAYFGATRGMTARNIERFVETLRSDQSVNQEDLEQVVERDRRLEEDGRSDNRRDREGARHEKRSGREGGESRESGRPLSEINANIAVLKARLAKLRGE